MCLLQASMSSFVQASGRGRERLVRVGGQPVDLALVDYVQKSTAEIDFRRCQVLVKNQGPWSVSYPIEFHTKTPTLPERRRPIFSLSSSLLLSPRSASFPSQKRLRGHARLFSAPRHGRVSNRLQSLPARASDFFRTRAAVREPAQSIRSSGRPFSPCTRYTRFRPCGSLPPPTLAYLGTRTVYANRRRDTRPDFPGRCAASAPGL